jgi:hypothetical protein
MAHRPALHRTARDSGTHTHTAAPRGGKDPTRSACPSPPAPPLTPVDVSLLAAEGCAFFPRRSRHRWRVASSTFLASRRLRTQGGSRFCGEIAYPPLLSLLLLLLLLLLYRTNPLRPHPSQSHPSLPLSPPPSQPPYTKKLLALTAPPSLPPSTTLRRMNGTQTSQSSPHPTPWHQRGGWTWPRARGRAPSPCRTRSEDRLTPAVPCVRSTGSHKLPLRPSGTNSSASKRLPPRPATQTTSGRTIGELVAHTLHLLSCPFRLLLVWSLGCLFMFLHGAKASYPKP